MMQVDVAFGKTGLRLDLPPGFDYRLLEARSAQPLADSARAIEQALDSPIAGPPLADVAAGKRSAAARWPPTHALTLLLSDPSRSLLGVSLAT